MEEGPLPASQLVCDLRHQPDSSNRERKTEPKLYRKRRANIARVKLGGSRRKLRRVADD